ncbi:LysR family transcriptional regulator [Halovulum dunhuangense]|uniref:LysR family transcriptional regulator n=1 Tax=Halovulum dunhuangense TaxID=1505036 RepID=A0A849L4X1_9RHOB|nr:LysR family transcriptional regulator [Halovulum dunhuangense]NNU81406.1 LysR family transcriptional regulator [Halovulum dunhuangense]
MPRNLDLTALRAFVTVAETGGVTRAAGQLNLTQSAVSMQLKRLEESLGQPLLNRRGRGVALTPQGEQLLSYGRRMLSLNDEVWGLMRDDAFEGELRIGVPHDIVYPHVPGVLQRVAAEYPRLRVELISSFTRSLKEQFARGELDLILTTEQGVDRGGETLQTVPLMWVGAPAGSAWRQRPLRLAFETACIFRPTVQRLLDDAGIAWDMVVNSDSTRTVDAVVSADLAIHANLAGNAVPHLEIIDHGGALPELPVVAINMYTSTNGEAPLADAVAKFVREAYQPRFAAVAAQ